VVVDALPLAIPEPTFADRRPLPEPERPLPAHRRVIFLDVENTSRAEHIARTIEHLAIDRVGARTEFVAVGNWRVIGADTARLLARQGAQLVHSAPSTGVRDWSDLRIAVSAGVWLGVARPGDILEIVSDDRAFDAVGDVAATLGIAFRRLSHRALAGAAAPERVVVEEDGQPPSRGSRGRRRGRRGRGGGRPAPAGHAAEPRRHEGARHEPARHEPARQHEPVRAEATPHTAPHDEVVGVVRELVARTQDGAVLIDTLANALKSRGFRRPAGSPRLITRLRRIKELHVSPTGMISLVETTAESPAEDASPAAASEPPTGDGEPVALEPVARPDEGATAPVAAPRRRRSRRRGRRRGRGAPTPLGGA
jgi:hypothetical protein